MSPDPGSYPDPPTHQARSPKYKLRKYILKVVIFCGGYATRFNKGRPGPLKPLIKINGIPILKRIISIL